MELLVTQIQETFQKGIYYNPASLHYKCKRNIFCVRCNMPNLQICIGFENYDLCMSCVKDLTDELCGTSQPTADTTMTQKMYIPSLVVAKHTVQSYSEKKTTQQMFVWTTKKTHCSDDSKIENPKIQIRTMQQTYETDESSYNTLMMQDMYSTRKKIQNKISAFFNI